MFSPNLVLLTKHDMKILKTSHISPFGGSNFVLQEFENKRIEHLLEQHLPKLPTQCKYSWKDLLYSFWSIYFFKYCKITKEELILLDGEIILC